VTEAHEERRDVDPERWLEERTAQLLERENELARGEARLRDAIAAHKNAIRARGRAADDARSSGAQLSALHARRAAELGEREERLAAREAELERRLRERELEHGEAPRAAGTPDLDEREQELAARERMLEERVGAVAARERALARRHAELEQAAAAFEARQRVASAAAEPESASRWTLVQLEHLVDAAVAREPTRAEEWLPYLLSLREHADYDGRLPEAFDALIEDVFAELLEPPA
jgi:hypothetical protein